MATGQRPPTSPPPELGAMDAGWSEDEQPTVARPSRMPTAPVRITIPEELPTAPGVQGSGLDLNIREQPVDIQDRVTMAPRMSPNAYAKFLMAEGTDDTSADAPPPTEFEAEAPEFGLTLEAPAELPSSDLPTAPPPTGLMEGSLARVPPSSSVEGIVLDPASLPTDYLPPAPPVSKPREEVPIFSGRFSSAPPRADDREQMMKDRFAMGDFSGALELADQTLAQNPSHTGALSLAKKCREVLEDMYTSRISDIRKVPSIIMGPDQIRWLSLNHRAGFLLSLIDGMSSVDDILDISGMPRLDALRILSSLLEQKVVSLD